MGNEFFLEFKKNSDNMIHMLENTVVQVNAVMNAEYENYKGDDKGYGHRILSLQHKRDEIIRLVGALKEARVKLGDSSKKISWWDRWVEIPLRNWGDRPIDKEKMRDLIGL